MNGPFIIVLKMLWWLLTRRKLRINTIDVLLHRIYQIKLEPCFITARVLGNSSFKHQGPPGHRTWLKEHKTSGNVLDVLCTLNLSPIDGGGSGKVWFLYIFWFNHLQKKRFIWCIFQISNPQFPLVRTQNFTYVCVLGGKKG